MRGLLVIITVVLLGGAPLGGLTARAQGGPDEGWNNIARPTAGAPLERLDELYSSLNSLGAMDQAEDVQSIRSRLVDADPQMGYVISFLQPLSHIPEIPEAELMAVYVRSGEFILDNMGPDPFTVIPGGDGTINTVTIGGDEQVAYYTVNEGASGLLQNENNQDCTGYCVVTPPPFGAANEPRIALQLMEGDWVILPGAELCVWCLFNQHLGAGVTTGILYVFPLLPATVSNEEFTWIQQWDAAPQPEYQQASNPTTLTATMDGSGTDEPLLGVMSWAYFNPAPSCRSG
jgi:hypothetical protein